MNILYFIVVRYLQMECSFLSDYVEYNVFVLYEIFIFHIQFSLICIKAIE